MSNLFIGLGEALFDVFLSPEGTPVKSVLGGAPLNCAVMLHQLAAADGDAGMPVSRIGDDELGRRMLGELAARGVRCDGVQLDPVAATSRVLVRLSGREPSYEIVRDVAWDRLAWTPDMAGLAAAATGVCFGTLGQRSLTARGTIRRFVKSAVRAVRLFDVNLRQAFYSAESLAAGCALADVIKLNEDELPRVLPLLELDRAEDAQQDPSRARADQARRLRETFAARAVVVTRGAAGTEWHDADGVTTGPVPTFPLHPDADSVGAGDACSAGLLYGAVHGWPVPRIVELANRLGAYVASQPGATPLLPAGVLPGRDGSVP